MLLEPVVRSMVAGCWLTIVDPEASTPKTSKEGISSVGSVNKKAAKIVASKIPGGTQALQLYAEQSFQKNASKAQSRARVFRDPARYQAISDALLDTIYEIRSPEESTQDIIKSLRENEK